MIVKNTSIKYDASKGVFYCKSYFENEQGQIFRTAIICASEEYLSGHLKKRLEAVMENNVKDPNIQQWFKDVIDHISVTEEPLQGQVMGNAIIDTYPKTEAMLAAAKSFLNMA